MGLSESDIQKFMDDLLDSEDCQQYIEKLDYLGLRKTLAESEVKGEELNRVLKEFLNKFGVTVLLVIE